MSRLASILRKYLTVPTLLAFIGLSSLAALVDARRPSGYSPLRSQTLQQERVNKLSAEAADLSSQFEDWAKQYSSGMGPEVLSQGLELSARRRTTLKELITVDPARALSLAVTPEIREALPQTVQQNLEKEVSAYGDFFVTIADKTEPVTGAFSESKVVHFAVINGVTYRAFVYGRWLNMTSKKNIPISGIAIDDVLAVNEHSIRVLPEEARYPLDAPTVVDVGQASMQPWEFSREAEALSAREMLIGPDTEAHPELANQEAANGQTAESSWTEGPKTILVIRVDFSDLQGEAVVDSAALGVINTDTNNFYKSNSYNKTSLQATAITPVLRMPQTTSFYTSQADPTGWYQMLTDAQALAKAAGFDSANYSLYVVDTKQLTFPVAFGGRANIGAAGAHLNGSFGASLTEHELGHNYGLRHANLWRTTDGTIIGPGNNVEYGNPFDVMGGGFDSRAHFSAHYKWRLGWLGDANIQTITTDGTYRVFAFDSSSSDGIRIIKVKKNSTKDYWIEFRQLFTDNNRAFNGAIIGWDDASENYAINRLLDMTPNTASDATDAPLLIGQAFDDTENRIRITPIAKGNTTPQSLDVRVELNVGCTFNIGQTSQTFTASGGEGTIAVNTLSGCVPPVTANAAWLFAFPTDTGGVKYTVAANYDSQPRTGTITVANQTFTVQQAAAVTSCVPRPANLTAWWRGEGNALDQTGTNNGTMSNNTSFAAGQIGAGFNGGVVSVPDSSGLALNRSMTFEGWLKVNSYGGTIIERRDNGSSGNFAASYNVIVQSNGVLSFFVGADKTSGFGFSTPSPVPLNQFFHFAAMLDDINSEMRIYINGVLVRQGSQLKRPYDLDPNAQPRVNIGNIDGITDEFSVYNRALTTSEIQAIYNAGVATTGATGKCLSFSSIQYNAAGYNANEGSGFTNITVSRSGDNSGSASVTYAISNGTAREGKDYVAAFGTLNFAAGEPSKTFPILLIDNALVDGTRTVNLSLGNPTGGSLAAQSTAVLNISDNDASAGANPLDDPRSFVQFHYFDFFGRYPDQSGWDFWTNSITSCGANQGCVEVKRINNSAAFFLSIEFQQTGYLVYKMYKAAFGNIANAPVPIRFEEFVPDTQQIGSGVVVNQGNWQQQLEANKQAFALAFVQRTHFLTDYPISFSPSGFVNTLFARAGVTPSTADRNAAIAEFGTATTTSDINARARALRDVAENSILNQQEFNRAFVLMQYFGYLRRNPYDPPELTLDYQGYNFWLNKLNQFNGNYIAAEMVKAFISSDEYRHRFGS